MHVHVNKLYNAHYIIQNIVENNNVLCWIAKASVGTKSNQLENVLTSHKLIK